MKHEYMTGECQLYYSKARRYNFATGMSGGVAYVYDPGTSVCCSVQFRNGGIV